jgi:hypothetical protein
MPLPSSRVIDPRWSRHHRPTASATMTAECVITRATGEGTTSPDGTWTPPQAVTVYAGVCRVQAATTHERLMPRGETTETHHRYLVAVQWDAGDPAIGDQVTVTASVDPHLAGKQLRVIDVRYGSEQWQRDLICDETEH